jgi:hypothetical protein
MDVVKIKISIEQIRSYTVILMEDDSTDFVEHDGILLDRKLLSLLRGNIFDLEEVADVEKIYELEFVSPSYLTDNIQTTGDIDITAYTKIPPYPSWIIGDDGEWTPPIPYPDGNGSGMGTLYNWNEDTTSWKDILV